MAWLDLAGLQHFLLKLKTNGVKISEARYTVTTSAGQTVSYTVPDFTASTMTLDVYVNGLHCIPTVDYTLSGNVVTMLNDLDVGQTVEFVKRWVTF